MGDFAALVLPGSFHSGVGILLDTFMLVRLRVDQKFQHAGHAVTMQTQLKLLGAAGRDVALSDGRTLVLDADIGANGTFDLVHIPGFAVASTQALRERLEASAGLLAWLRRQHQAGALISASGSGVFLLAAAGLLAAGEMPVPLPGALRPIWRELYPRLPIDSARPMVEARGLAMSGGAAADPALMVRLVDLLIAPEIGRWVASVIGADRIIEDQLPTDSLVADAQRWLEQHYAGSVSITHLAAELAVSHHTLIRRFTRAAGMPPREYVQRLRVNAASIMLRRTNRKIDQVASLIGYRDVRSFRTIFRRHSGMSPLQYRQAMSGRARPETAEPKD